MSDVPLHDQFKRRTKSDIRREMMGRELWPLFVRERERLKDEGVPAERAWILAYDVMNADHPVDSDAEPVSEGEGVASKRQVRGRDLGDASKDLFVEKTCTTARTVEWVAANLRISDPSAEDAPSSEAWSMLCWVKGSPSAEAQFWGSIYTKLMPPRQQLDQESKLKDDGRNVVDLISRIRQSKEDAENVGLRDSETAGSDGDTEEGSD